MNIHIYIPILEKYIIEPLDINWPKDLTHLIVRMISNMHVLTSCGYNNLIIYKNNCIYFFGNNLEGDFDERRNIPMPKKLGLRDVLKVSCGSEHVVCVTNENLHFWGNRENAVSSKNVKQHKFIMSDDVVPHISFKNVNQHKFIMTNIADVVCGYDNTFYLLKGGSLYGNGNNEFGELGLGDNNKRNIPQKICSNVRSIVTKFHHLFAFMNDGKVFSWGQNSSKQLGRYGVWNRPEEVKLSNIIAISCGIRHSLAVVKSNNSISELYVWGCSDAAGRSNNNCTFRRPRKLKISNNDWESRVMSVACDISNMLALTDNGDVYIWAYKCEKYDKNCVKNVYESIKINISNVTSINCGHQHCIFVTMMGDIYFLGEIYNGQIESDDDEHSLGIFDNPQQLLMINI